MQGTHICQLCNQPHTIEMCEHHPESRKLNCPYCNLCEHGVNIYSQCNGCHVNDDQSWRIAPLTDDEIERLQQEISRNPNLQPSRGMPNRQRYYRSDDHEPLWKILLIDYLKLKKEPSK